MSTLASVDDISGLRLEEEKIIEEVRLQALEWGSYGIANVLMADATKRFQEEQQPKVIRAGLEPVLQESYRGQIRKDRGAYRGGHH